MNLLVYYRCLKKKNKSLIYVKYPLFLQKTKRIIYTKEQIKNSKEKVSYDYVSQDYKKKQVFCLWYLPF